MGRNGREALQTGIKLGMTHIDTAEMYTGAEEVVAEAIRGIRDKIFLVSKVLPFQCVLQRNASSLRRQPEAPADRLPRCLSSTLVEWLPSYRRDDAGNGGTRRGRKDPAYRRK